MVIIRKNGQNWSGKEFSGHPAKVYQSFEDASEALKNYYLFEYSEKTKEYIPNERPGKVEFVFLSENRKIKLLRENKIRF